MEETFFFVCWIIVLFSLHTLKNALMSVHDLSKKKKINSRFLSLQKSVNEENQGLKVVNPSLKQLRFLQTLTSKAKGTEQGSSKEEILLFIGKVTLGTNAFSFCQGSWKEDKRFEVRWTKIFGGNYSVRQRLRMQKLDIVGKAADSLGP